MAKKIVLGKRATSCRHVVSFPMPCEDNGSIEVEFRQPTRTEFASFTDGLQAAIKATRSSRKMEFLRVKPEDYADEDVEVWPENQRTCSLFCEIRTQ